MEENQKYKKIVDEQLEQKLKNHELWLRGEENLEHSFSGIDFINCNLSVLNNKILKNSDFSNSIIGKNSNIDYKNIIKVSFENTNFSGSIIKNISFRSCDFKETNFRNSELKNVNFDENSSLEGADFRGAEYDINIFSKEQKEQIILTDKDYELYQEKKKNEELKKQNNILEKDNEEKEEKLINVSDNQINKIVESFEKLEKNFKREEIIWISISFILFISLLYFFTIPIFDMFLYEKIYYIIFYGILGIIGFIILFSTLILEIFIEDKTDNKNIKNYIKEFFLFISRWWFFIAYIILLLYLFSTFLGSLKKPEESLFKVSYYGFIPFGVILTTFLYFSVTQYSTSKKLRIENQNKVALLHGMIGIKADTDKDMDKNIFYQNVANIVFSKVYEGKEENLPLDKVLELVKIINSNNKK